VGHTPTIGAPPAAGLLSILVSSRIYAA